MITRRFEKCGAEEKALCKELMGKFHPELAKEGVKVDLVFAHAPEDDDGNVMGPAVKHHGYPATSVARIVSLKDREKGNGDCEITLDGDAWPDFSEDERAAVMDHELYHFRLQRDKENDVKHDSGNRPKMTMRHHDVQIGWFNEIATRHGTASMERKQAVQLIADNGQYYWPDLVQMPQVQMLASAAA